MQSPQNNNLNNIQNNAKQKMEFIKFSHVVAVELKKIKKHISGLTLSQIQCLEFYKAELNNWEEIVRESFSSDNSCVQMIDKLKTIINRIEKSVEMATLSQNIDDTQSQVWIPPCNIQNMQIFEIIDTPNEKCDNITDAHVAKTSRTLTSKCIEEDIDLTECSLSECRSVPAICCINSQSMDLFDDVENLRTRGTKRTYPETGKVVKNARISKRKSTKENINPLQTVVCNVLSNSQSMDLFDSNEIIKPKRNKRSNTKKKHVAKQRTKLIHKSTDTMDLEYQSSQLQIDTNNLTITESQVISGLSGLSIENELFNKQVEGGKSIQVSNKNKEQDLGLQHNENQSEVVIIGSIENVVSYEKASKQLTLHNVTQSIIDICSDEKNIMNETCDFTAETITLEVNKLINNEFDKLSYENKLEHLTKTIGDMMSCSNDDLMSSSSFKKLKVFMEEEIPRKMTTEFKNFKESKTWTQLQCNLKVENSLTCTMGKFKGSNETVNISDEPNAAQSLVLSSDFGRIFNTNLFGIDFTSTKQK